MGQACGCSDAPEDGSRPDTDLKIKARKNATPDDVESDSEQEEYLAPSDSAAPNDPELTPRPAHSAQSNETARAQFKDAVQNGESQQVMYLNQEYPDLNLLQERFENGDSCLQIAVRHQHSELIVYFLDNGVDVTHTYLSMLRQNQNQKITISSMSKIQRRTTRRFTRRYEHGM